MRTCYILKLIADRYYLFLSLLFFQALYFCVPFREQLLEYYLNNKNIGDVEENLLTCLADLFSQVRTQGAVCLITQLERDT